MYNVTSWALFSIIMSILYMGIMLIALIQTWIHGFPVDYYSTSPSLVMLNKIPEMPMMHRMLGLVVDGIGLAIILVCIYHFARLMLQFRSRKIFSPTTISLVIKLTSVALVWALYNPVRYMALSLITSLHNPTGQREISLAIGSSDFINIIVIGCLVMLTSFMKEGYALQQERDLTI